MKGRLIEARVYKYLLSLFRNDSGVVADVSLRFGNDSKNLVSLDALIKTGKLGDLPVDPASLIARKLEIFSRFFSSFN